MQQEYRYPVIGLTGGVGAGKSTVLSFLQENYGFYVIQADLMARKLMEPGKEAYKAVCDFLGPVILQENGEIDRKIMADIIFNDPAKREKIDQLTHPLVWEAIRKEAGKHADQPVVIEAAVPSKDFRDICDKMWYLYTSREVRIRRLKESRGYSDKKAESIMANQATESEFRSFADAQIDNSGSEEETRKQIEALLEKVNDKDSKTT